VVVELHSFFTSTADGDEWLASFLNSFTLIGGWVGHGVGLDIWDKR